MTFGLVEGLVGRAGGAVEGFVGRTEGDSGAEAHGKLMIIRALRELGETGADFVYQFERSGAVGAGQDGGEFLTAVAADDVGLAQPLT